MVGRRRACKNYEPIFDRVIPEISVGMLKKDSRRGRVYIPHFLLLSHLTSSGHFPLTSTRIWPKVPFLRFLDRQELELPAFAPCWAGYTIGEMQCAQDAMSNRAVATSLIAVSA